MQHSLKESVKVYILRNKNRKWLHRLVRVLSCLVVFCTTYALILPAITMEQEPFCGLEEHSHTADCYQQTVEQKLICTTGSLALHVHGTGCYDAENKLICGQADYVIHTHDHSCLDSNGMLVCTLPERSAHVHGDSCYATPEEIPHVHVEDCQTRQRGDLICTKEEYDGHTHTDSCYIRSDELECTLTEQHVHNDDCYVYPLSCTQSTEPHVHDSSCHTTGDLLCNTPAGHIHGDSCVEKVHNCQNTEEDHVCGDECYTQVSVCDIPENHQHETGCYADVLICGKEEGQAHTHDDACYSTEPKLNCELVENHIHTDACYKKVLNCGLDEDPGYRHTDECYNWETSYTCGYEEGEMETLERELICTEPIAATHVHGEGCFEEIRSEAKPVCGNTSEDHVHTDDCYTIACGLEVHTHEKACYSNPDADVESREVWEATFAHVELTGDRYKDVVAIAETQLGYTESSRNYAVWDDDSVHGYTRYGDWYGIPYGDWCGMFVSFCLRYAGVDDIPVNYGVRPWIEDLSKLGLYHRAEDYTPKSGDIIFYDWEGDNLSDHVGIVAKIIEGTETEPARVKAIEGNSSNCVRYVTYDMDDPQILGYSELLEKEEEEEQTTYYCSLEEHTHVEECYDAEGNLICQTAEHTHTEECTVAPVYYCGMEEHTHAEECCDSDGNVICGRDEHIHTSECKSQGTIEITQDMLLDISNGPAVFIFADGNQEGNEEAPMLFAAKTVVDLKQYLAESNGTYFFTLIDTDNKELPKDDNGNYVVTADTSYKLTLSIQSPDGFAPGTYQYQLPDGLTVNGGSGEFALTDGTIVGSWTVGDDGLITMVFNENMNNRTDVTISATMGTKFGETEEKIDFDGKIFVVVTKAPDEIADTKVSKWGTQGNGTHSKPDPNKIYWTATIEGSESSVIPGSTITDSIVTDNHSYTESDIANGLTIKAEQVDPETEMIVEGTSHEWIVNENDPNLTWTENGWSYNMPQTVVCSECENTITLGNENWVYQIKYTSTPDESSSAGTLIYKNNIIADDQTAEGSASHKQEDIGASIMKTGNFVGDASGGTFIWKIRAQIPAMEPDGQAVYSWHIWDDLQIRTSNDGNAGYQDNAIHLANVQMVYGDSLLTVPEISNATEADIVAWANTDSEDSRGGETFNRRIDFFCRCQCDASDCQLCNNGCGSIDTDGFCRCWTVDEDVEIILTYKTNDPELIAEYGGKGNNLRNRVALYHMNNIDGNWTESKDDESKVSVPIPGVFRKEITKDFDGYTATYTITVNEAKLQLSDGTPITIHDMMTDTLAYVSGSLVITTEDASGQTGTLTQGTDYTATYDGSGNVKDSAENPLHILDIVILNPQPVTYILNYDATLIIPDEVDGGIKYSNAASVEIWGNNITADSDEKIYADINIAAETYKVEINKVDADTKAPLAGAEFGLYNQTGGLITSGITDEKGYLLFETNITNGIILREHVLYYIQEIAAPELYRTEDTKFWFCFCNHKDASCSECDEVIQGTDDAFRIPFETIGNIEAENHFTAYVLPETGGAGTDLYTAGGLLLIMAASLILLYNHKKCRREDYESS